MCIRDRGKFHAGQVDFGGKPLSAGIHRDGPAIARLLPLEIDPAEVQHQPRQAGVVADLIGLIGGNAWQVGQGAAIGQIARCV